MVYELGTYKMYNGREFKLSLDAEEWKVFSYVLGVYESAKSWKEFQNKTAALVKEFAQKIAQNMEDINTTGKPRLANWERVRLY